MANNGVMDLRRDLGGVKEKMAGLNALTVTEKRDFSEDEQTQWDGLAAEAKFLQRQIERLDAIGEMPAVAAGAGSVAGGVDQRGINAPAIVQRPTKDDPKEIFLRYLRTDDEGAKAELRAYNNTDMNVGTSADGGYAVPTGLVQDIVKRRDEMMLAPKLGVRRVPGKGTTVNYPIDGEADVLFTSVAEANSIAQDAPAMGVKAFTLVKYAKYITLSWELLRDEDAAVESFITDWVARGWAGTHNSLLVTEALANGTAGLTLDAAAAIGAAEVPELVGKLLPEYQDQAQWLINPSTLAYLRGLTGNAFQFAPTPNAGGNTLGGYPVNQTSYMTALGASVKSLVFGNFNFLGMREGTSLTSLRDPYTGAGTGQIKLWFHFDAVYGVLQAEAIQYATHPSS